MNQSNVLRLRKILPLGFVALLISGSCWADRAENCIRTHIKNNSLHYKNVCDQPVTMFYCSGKKPMFGGAVCGKGGKASPYYTYRKTMRAGESDYFFDNVDMRFVVCGGMVPEPAFSSTPDGAFQCEKAPPPLGERPPSYRKAADLFVRLHPKSADAMLADVEAWAGGQR